MSKHRVGIVGLGMALKPHLQSLEELGDRVEIAACFTPSAERRAAFASNHRHPVVDNLETILSDRSIDVVFVLTPPMAHLQVVERCAAAGKHVLLEKPIDVSSERARRAVGAMEKAGRKLAIMLQHRFRAASLQLAKAVRAGELGPLVSGSAAIRWWRTPEYFAQPGRGMQARDGGGVLITQAIHTLDLFQSLAGPIVKVAAFANTSPLRTIDTEDVVGAGVEFANGAVGTIDATTVAYPGFPERIELACAKATAVLAAETLDFYGQDGRHTHHQGGPSKSGGADPMAFANDAHKALIVDFLEAIDANREPTTNGREALKVHLLIEAMLRSAEEGKAIAVATA
ncbi:MAG TPA: Gfo/Idh/MocA family oxidoreductase [Hyphomicrobiaceae bacterium]|nr:Gfo/Idh/MocA family oxidoreductase [Hyphomicrobiaceae bacterium]